jgi:hypothetical protein
MVLNWRDLEEKKSQKVNNKSLRGGMDGEGRINKIKQIRSTRRFRKICVGE